VRQIVVALVVVFVALAVAAVVVRPWTTGEDRPQPHVDELL
jgi:hypothetical protein